MVRSGSICAGMLPAAAWRANDANSSLKYVAGMGEVSPPTQSDASLASVRWQYAKPFTPPLRRVMLQCGSGTSKFSRFELVRHGRWVSRPGRPATTGAHQNLPLNPLVDPATLRACSSHLTYHPPAVKPNVAYGAIDARCKRLFRWQLSGNFPGQLPPRASRPSSSTRANSSRRWKVRGHPHSSNLTPIPLLLPTIHTSH